MARRFLKLWHYCATLGLHWLHSLRSLVAWSWVLSPVLHWPVYINTVLFVLFFLHWTVDCAVQTEVMVHGASAKAHSNCDTFIMDEGYLCTWKITALRLCGGQLRLLYRCSWWMQLNTWHRQQTICRRKKCCILPTVWKLIAYSKVKTNWVNF